MTRHGSSTWLGCRSERSHPLQIVHGRRLPCRLGLSRDCCGGHAMTSRRRNKRLKLTVWDQLRARISDYTEAAIEDSWKGDGDPADFDLKELRCKLALMELNSHISKMERELS